MPGPRCEETEEGPQAPNRHSLCFPLPLPSRRVHPPGPFIGSPVSVSAGGDCLSPHEACVGTARGLIDVRRVGEDFSRNCCFCWVWATAFSHIHIHFPPSCMGQWRIVGLLNCHMRTLKTTVSITIIP